MRIRATIIALCACFLAGCSENTPEAATEQMAGQDVAESAPAAALKAPGPAPVEAALPRIAYTYRMGFRLPASEIATVQDAHVALCDRLGPQRCQIVAMDRSAAEDSYSRGTLKLRVAAGIARQFQGDLTRISDQAGGRAVDSAIEAEDVSKAMVDTEARIAQRSLLVERLTEVLRNRTGTVAEMVEAERSVAQAQEELDQARAWLAELRTRVATSLFEIDYSAAAPASGPLGDTMADTLAKSTSLFTASLEALVLLFVALLPWLLVIVPLLLVVRALKRRGRWPLWPAADSAPAEAPERADRG